MPCSRYMPVRRDDVAGTGCHRNCLHRVMVEAYREHRDAWERRRDAEAMGYATEARDYAWHFRDPAPTFKDWLKSWSIATRAGDELEATG